VNLQNIEKDKLRRGQCAGRPGSLIPTIRLDGRVNLLKSIGRELKHRERIRLHTGTSEIICRVILFDRDRLQPGDSALAQFVLESKAVAVAGDRFVIRTFSPLVTIGGGVIVDAAPSKHKRFDPQTLAGMERLEGSQENVVEQILLKAKYSPLNPFEIATRIGEDLSKITKTLDSMEGEQMLVAIPSGRELKYLHKEFYEKLKERFLSSLKDYLAARADRMDMPSVELRSALLRLTDPGTFNFIRDELCEKQIIYKKDSKIGLVGHKIDLTPREQKIAGEVEKIFQTAGMESPLETTVLETLNLNPALFQKIMSSLIQAGKVIRLSEKVTYHVDALKAAEDFVKAFLKKNPCVTIIDVRNELQLSRKYGQAILEHFDKISLTKRVGDDHVPV
jgi:selenocysteine-specific elongation factor